MLMFVNKKNQTDLKYENSKFINSKKARRPFKVVKLNKVKNKS